ncbi:hypothetical protein BH747_03960 [Enterococcus villorum]|uniref:Cell division protein n=2 Tax=Enterococcus villorum TaxID=112904 RepID=A0A1V8YF76_9ENTE|nr:hypothetical protein BH747_03960 [Enterococcus villorum]OQO72875.1 hypothetical protein BH744_10925 [Enterococcus villorum]
MYTKNKLKTTNFIAVLAVSIIFIFPQLVTKNMIIGSDSIFHFNRFYETAEQIRNGNFSYFISLYGFQQSGRIVNAFYSPFFAYLHGIIVLLSKNWFMYQVLSNLILFIIAGTSMNIFLNKGGLNNSKCLFGSIVFMTTFSIQYWVTRQGFSSWGSAFLPACLSVIFELNNTGKIPKYKVGIYTALMFQIHILSSLILVMTYIPIFMYSFLKNNKKLPFVFNLLKEILLFFILTANIWVSYLIITKENELIAPFINTSMSSNTINQNSYYWLLNPVFFLLIIIFTIGKFIYLWKEINIFNKLLVSIAVFFLILSTSFVPWNTLIEHNVKFAEYIQFPFRFFVPVTILIIYLFLSICNFKKFFNLLIAICISQSIFLMLTTLKNWDDDNKYIASGEKTLIDTSFSPKEIKHSFFIKDKRKSLVYLQKTTPDYLPLYRRTNANNYELYGKEIIENNNNFKKTIGKGSISIQPLTQYEGALEYPIVIYEGTNITQNGQTLCPDKLKLSPIGVPTIFLNNYENSKITIGFQPPKTVSFMIVLSMISWIDVFVIKLIRLSKFK